MCINMATKLAITIDMYIAVKFYNLVLTLNNELATCTALLSGVGTASTHLVK